MRDRLITAALKIAAAERGGLDQEDSEAELDRAVQIFDEEVVRYYHNSLEEASPEAG